MKILQIDRNSYYGSDTASLTLTNLWKMFKNGKTPNSDYGENRDWNVDLVPKFVMADGKLVKLLLKTNVSQYLDWKAIDEVFVYQWDNGGLFSKAKGVIHKVPSNDSEAVSSNLMGMWEKNRCRKFFQFIQKFDINVEKTHKGMNMNGPFSKVIEYFGLETNTTDFIGHAMALYTNDDFLDSSALSTIEKIKLYGNSVNKYGDTPFLYPLYGLSGLSEGFSRMCALNGGVYMLNRECDEILLDENGVFTGIKSNEEIAYGKILITEPSYAVKNKMVKSTGKVIRCICILDHCIPKTNDVASCQIILPQRQIGRKSGNYLI
jgi:Rab GDP dissociation inhibitor